MVAMACLEPALNLFCEPSVVVQSVAAVGSMGIGGVALSASVWYLRREFLFMEACKSGELHCS